MASKKITRNEFLKKGLALGLAVGGSTILGRTDELFAKGKMKEMPDLVAVKNAEPDVMFKKAINMMGGMSQYVKKGQTVVVKPNIVVGFGAETAATTNPILVKAIIEECFKSGAKKVYVFDHVGIMDPPETCYKKSGIEEAAKTAGATVMHADDLKYYKEMKITENIKILKSAMIHELILDSDVFINVPILKTHTATGMTCAMKNLMGTVYDRTFFHHNGLDQCIADIYHYCKPTLNIVDAYRTGTTGEGFSLPTKKNTLLISKDIVAADSAASKILGSYANHIDYGHSMKIGNKNLNELKIARFAF